MNAAKTVNFTIRKFATSSANSQLVKAPIQVFGLHGRYATALYSAAVKQKQLEAVEKDILTLGKAINTDQAFKEFLFSPILSRTIKADAVKEIASKLSFTATATNLLALLAENGRLKTLPTIVTAFNTIMAAHRGDLPIEVTSAKALDSATQQELQKVLQKFAKKGEIVSIAYKTDPSIVGGLIVSVGDKYVDLSIANKLKRYSAALTSTV